MVPLDSSGPVGRYVPIEETEILIMCSVFVNHMKRIRNTNDKLVDVIVFYPKKNIKLQPVPPPMSLEALLTPWIFLSQIFYVGLLGLFNVHFDIQFFI